jgi:hypothetical protein
MHACRNEAAQRAKEKGQDENGVGEESDGVVPGHGRVEAHCQHISNKLATPDHRERENDVGEQAEMWCRDMAV